MNIPNPDLDFLPIPDPGSRIQASKRHRIPDLGSGSATLVLTIKYDILEGVSYPVKQDDFFPYADIANGYWTG
jgi:hypothetical protein